MDIRGALIGMAGFRLFSSMMELIAALLIIRSGSIRMAMRINALLGLVGPAVLLCVSLIGVSGMDGKVGSGRLIMVIVGVALIFFGMR